MVLCTLYPIFVLADRANPGRHKKQGGSMSPLNMKMVASIPILDIDSSDSFELDFQISDEAPNAGPPPDECSAPRTTCASTCSNNLTSCTGSRNCCF